MGTNFLLQIENPADVCVRCVMALEEGDVGAIVGGCVVGLVALVLRRIDLTRIRKGKKPLFKK